MKQNIFTLAFTFCTIFSIFAFDCPTSKVVQADQFFSYFGQLRGGTISNSLIFSEPTEIKAADKGKAVVLISDFEDSTDFFPSTLGNAAIISHNDNIITVYANIDGKSISEQTKESAYIETGTELGFSGNSAWQQGRSSLEFQIIDIEKNTSINPRLFMPRVGKELPLYYGDVVLQNKNGKRFKVASQTYVPSGLYKVYRKRQAVAIPYKTRVSINGTAVDQISYDALIQNDLQICAAGKKNYPKSVLYPNNELQLIGEVSLTPGKNALQLLLADILGKETTATYIVNVY